MPNPESRFAFDVRCWMFGVRSFLADSKGRVAESGLRHSTRNRAWGNPPWVRIPPLPPALGLERSEKVEAVRPEESVRARRVAEKCHKFRLDLNLFCTAYCISAEWLRYYLLFAGIHRLLAGLLAQIHRSFTLTSKSRHDSTQTRYPTFCSKQTAQNASSPPKSISEKNRRRFAF